MRESMTGKTVVFIVFPAMIMLGACAEDMAPQDALQAMEAQPFQRDTLESSIEALQAALERTPEDPWVYLGLARAYLIGGYKSGGRFRFTSFFPESVDNARELVEHALKLNPDLSRAHAMRARLQIIEGEYREAWDTLNTAHELDRDGFHPWYLMGVLNRYYKEYDQSRKMLRRAMAASVHPYQKRWVLGQRKEIAEATNDAGAEEKLHREIVTMFPNEAHGYGNYGAFLLEQKRYEDAILQYEKALQIQRYPLAEQQLEKARRLASEAP